MTHALIARATTLGAALAVTAAGLVAVAPTAHAATGQKAFSCRTEYGSFGAPVTFDVRLPKRGDQGSRVSSRKAVLSVMLPDSLIDALRDAGVTKLSGSATSAEIHVGGAPVRLQGISFTDQLLPPDGPMTIKARGTTTVFQLRRAGTLPVSVGKSFRITAKDQDGVELIDRVRCGLDDPAAAQIGSIRVVS